MRYYKVSAKCGHVRRNYYIVKDFYVEMGDGKEAAAYVRQLPRVKHDQKDAIRSVLEITEEEFLAGLDLMTSDPYFHCKSPQDQRRYCGVVLEGVKEEEEPRSWRKPTHARQRLIEEEEEHNYRKHRKYSLKDRNYQYRHHKH